MTIQDYIFKKTLRRKNNYRRCFSAGSLHDTKRRTGSSSKNQNSNLARTISTANRISQTSSDKNLTKWNLLNIQQTTKRDTYSDCVKSYKRHRNQIGRSNRTPSENKRIVKSSSAPLIRKPKKKRSKKKRKYNKNKSSRRFLKTITKSKANLPRLSPIKILTTQAAKDQIRYEQVCEDYVVEPNEEEHFLFRSPKKIQKFFENDVPNHSRGESISYLPRSRSDSHLVKYTKQFLTTNNSFFTLHNQSTKMPGMSPEKISRINRNKKRINQYAISTMKKQELRDAKNIEARKNCFHRYNNSVNKQIKYDEKQELLHRKGGYGYFSPSNVKK